METIIENCFREFCENCSGRCYGPESIPPDAEERIKLIAIRRAFVEKLATRIGGVVIVWGTASVLGAFGYLLMFTDFWVVSLIILAISYRIFSRSHEFELQAIIPEKGSGPSTLTKGDFAIIPIPFVGNLFKPRALSLIINIVQHIFGLVCIALPIWRLSRPDFCYGESESSSRGTCQFSVYIFYSLTIVGAALVLLVSGVLDYWMIYRKLLSNQLFRAKLNDPLVLKMFYKTVYDRCLKGSIFDGFDVNLTEFGIQWVQSDDFERQLLGAKLLNGLISVRNADKQNPQTADEQNPQTADALGRLGAYPGLMTRFVAMLSWNSGHAKKALVHEVTAIVCDLVASDHNCSMFADVPGAVEVVVSFLVPRDDNSGDGENSASRDAGKQGEGERRVSVVLSQSLQILCHLAATESTSGRALRQHIGGMASVLDKLRDLLKDFKEPALQLLSMEILYHLALEENARQSIGKKKGIIRSLFDLFQNNDSLVQSSVQREGEVVHSLNNAQSKSSENVRPGMVLSRLMLQNKANCKRLLRLKNRDGSQVKPFLHVMKVSLDGEESIVVSAAEILRSVWEYANKSTKTTIAPIVLRKILEAHTTPLMYEASLGLASRAMEELPLEKHMMVISPEEFIGRLVENLKDSPATIKVHTRVHNIRRYTVEVIIALVKMKEHLPKAFAEAFAEAFAKHIVDLKNDLEKICADPVYKVENFILLSGIMGCTRHSKDIKALCEDANNMLLRRFSPKSALQSCREAGV